MLLKVPFWQAGHYQRLSQVQTNIPFVPKLTHLGETIFLMERCQGSLLWEIEDRNAFAPALPSVLEKFVAGARAHGLVHADLRPWNIFYDAASGEFKIIDWGFSFFADQDLNLEPFWHIRSHLHARGHPLATPMQIDSTDAAKTLSVVNGTTSYEEAWHHAPTEMAWRPPWAAQPAR